MSWSVSAFGRPGDCADQIEKSAAASRCPEPEDSARKAICSSLVALLRAAPPKAVYRVSANGSQYAPDSTRPAEVNNSCSVALECLGIMV